MRPIYPNPTDVGITIPRHLLSERFHEGFLHALKDGQLTEIKQLRLSFREGYRAAKFYLRDLRQRQGIISFPIQGRVKIKAIGMH